MEPTHRHGELVLIDPSIRDLDPGDVCVARNPETGGTVIKRVRSRGDHTFALGSDNPTAGRDSRHFGSVGRDAIIGKVTISLRCRR